MGETHPVMARRLAGSGYRRVSNNYKLVSRIDREDWREAMAATHPSGLVWVDGLGQCGAEDHYRRAFSKDCIEIPTEVFKLVPGSTGCGVLGFLALLPINPCKRVLEL